MGVPLAVLLVILLLFPHPRPSQSFSLVPDVVFPLFLSTPQYIGSLWDSVCVLLHFVMLLMSS